MEIINIKQIVMILGIGALTIYSLTSQAGERDHNSKHSYSKNVSNDRYYGHHGKRHLNHYYGHSRYGQHRRGNHQHCQHRYNGNYYGYNRHNQYRHGKHHNSHKHGHRNHLVPRISGRLHIPGVHLKLHL